MLRTIINTIPGFIFYKGNGFNDKGNNKSDIESMIVKNDFEGSILSEDEEIIKNKKIKVYERRITDSQGNLKIEEITKTSVTNEDGQILGILGLASDITEKVELKEKLRKSIYIDSLTGVYNRVYFEKKRKN